MQLLQRDTSLQALVPGFPDLTHPPAAHHSDNLERTEQAASSETRPVDGRAVAARRPERGLHEEAAGLFMRGKE